MINVAINGLGRIGRATLKIVLKTPDLNLVAANDIGASDSVEYLLKYDTVYGRYEQSVEATDDGHLTIGDHRRRLLREKDPARLRRRGSCSSSGRVSCRYRLCDSQTDDRRAPAPCWGRFVMMISLQTLSSPSRRNWHVSRTHG
jgi:hypothetical protein